jgi:hypothetical protein
MLLEEDVVMEKREEIRPALRPPRDTIVPPPAPRDEEDRQQVSDETPPWTISPPPMPWPRVFPGL